MKTIATKNKTSSGARSSNPFFNKSGEGTFFSQNQNFETSFFTTKTIQPKLTIGQTGDKYEKEADSIADQVVQGFSEPKFTSIEQHRTPPKSKSIQRSVNTQATLQQEFEDTPEEKSVGKEDIVQRKPIFESNGEPTENDIQCNFAHGISSACRTDAITSAPKRIEQQIRSSEGGGNEMDSALRKDLEAKMNRDFSQVKIHDNSISHQMNRGLGSKAFTHKDNIYFNQGQYNPRSREGKRLMAHELTHTIQQGGGTQTNLVQRATVPNVVTALNAAITASDKPAYMDTLRVENRAHAENSNIYTTIQGHQTTGAITVNEAWQAVCILNYGNDSDRPHPWPLTIRNFFEGIILGEYTVPGIAPRLKDDILHLAVATAHTEITTSVSTGRGIGMGPFMDYMGKFNALWGISIYSGMSDAFNDALDSKGPKTERSRAIFNHLYRTDHQVTSDYNTDVVGINPGTERMRALADQYIGPESRNLIASARLQRLREAFFTQSLITSNSLTNPAYVAFKNRIRPFAEALNETDRDEIVNSHQWRSIIDATVKGTVTAGVIGTTLRQDLARFLQNAYQSAATPANTNLIVGVGTNITGTAATSSTGPAVVSAPPPALTADQQIFVDNMTLHATSLALISDTDVATMELFGRSTRDEAGLAFRTRIVINNPSLHRSGGDTFLRWPGASATGDIHRPTVSTGTGRGTTTYIATLTLEHPDGTPIARTAGALVPTIAITVTDNRYNAFAAHMTNFLILYYEGGVGDWYNPGDTVNYYGGQATLDIKPSFDLVPAPGSPYTLPEGIIVYGEAEVTQNGSSIGTFTPAEFPASAEDLNLGRIIAAGPAAPPAPDAMVVTVRFKEGSSSGAIFHTRTEAFNINPSVASAAGTPMPTQLTALSAQLAADKIALNTRTPGAAPAAGAGTIIDEMLHHGTPQTARIAQTILAGTITLEPMIIRPDSEAFMSAQVAARRNRWRANRTNRVIFALGDNPLDVAPMASPPNSLEESPSVNAVQWPLPRFSHTIHVHLTTSLTPLRQRTNFASILETIVHEAVHMVDNRPNSGTDIERYRTEFRAYWMEGGDFDLLRTEFNPGLNNFGPRSNKSRAIFEHLYHSSTYSYVKLNYDNNTNRFRDQVNAYLTPDGINLIVSQKLEDIRLAIVGFGVTYGPAERTNINDLYHGNAAAGILASTADDRQEISGNRAWRDLVESKGFSAPDLTAIKNDLNIPM